MSIFAQSKKVSIASLITASKISVSTIIQAANIDPNEISTGHHPSSLNKRAPSKLERLGEVNLENNKAEFNAIQKERAISERSTLENLGKENAVRTAGFSDVKKIMAMLKVYTPVIAAATLNPGADLSKESAVAATALMVKETLKVTEDLCHLIGVDHNNPDIGWIVSAIKTMAAAQVGSQWRRATVLGHGDLQSETYLEAYKSVLEMDKPLEVIDSRINISTSSKLQLSMMKSIMPIIMEVNTFESTMLQPGFLPERFKVDENAIIQHAGNFIVAEVSDFISRLNLQSGDDTRIIFFQGTLNHAGTIYAASLAKVADRKVEQYDSAEPGKRLDMMRKDFKDSPSGIHLDSVDAMFKVSFATLANLTAQVPIAYAEKLAEPKPSKSSRRTSTGNY